MGILKEAEIGFRRFLVLFLGLFVHRSTPFDPAVNFNACKFLFIRQDRIGDVLVSTPIFSFLKRAYPSVSIDVLLSSNNYSVLDNALHIRKRWLYRKSVFSALGLIRALRRERYDFVIDLMDNSSATSTLLLAFAGGKWNVGLEKDNAYVYDIRVPLLSRRDVHIVERLAELLKPLGVKVRNQDLRVDYTIADSSKAQVRQFLQSAGLNEKQIVGINISSGSETRFWGIANFRDLILSITSANRDYHILLLYHPRDVQRVRDIAVSLPRVHISLATNSFDHFAAFIHALNFLITPDTSAVHLAAAFQIPAVVLYVQSNKDLRIWEPYNSPSETLVTEVDDLTTIPPMRVFEAFQRLASRTPGKRP